MKLHILRGDILIYSIFTALFICLITNLTFRNQILYAIINPLILLLSFYFFKIQNREVADSLNKYIYIPIIIFLGLMPLLSFQQSPILTASLVSIVLFLLVLPLPKTAKNYLALICLLIYLFDGLLINQIIVLKDNSFIPLLNKDGIIFLDESIPTLVNKLRNEFKISLFLSSLIYNKLSLYTYFFFSNLGNFFTFRTFYDTLTLVNLYPLFFGLIYYFKNITKTTKVPLLMLLIFFISLGLNKHPDKFSSLYIAVPVLIYFILLGIGRVNLRLYFALFIISLFLLFAPKV